MGKNSTLTIYNETQQKEVTKNSTVHYGDVLTISYTQSTGYHIFKFDVQGATQEGEKYRLDGEIRVTYIEEINRYALNFDEEHIFVSLNGKKLASGDVVDYNSTLTIKYIETEGHTKKSLKVNGQELVGETYLVTDKYEKIEISYTEKISTYLVTFYDYNGSYINAIEVNWGTSASMTSPTREEDEMCSYVFSHWSESIGGDEADLGSVKEDMKVYAVYDVTYKEYSISNIPTQITVYYLSGTSSYTELQTLTSTDKVHYGDILRFAYSTSEGKEYLSLFINNLDPMESETNSTTGYLTGAVAGNLSITYFEQTAVYEVNFYNEDGSELLLTTSAEWGTGVTYTGTIPTKEETVEGRYNFKGWVILDGKEADLSNIKQDTDLYANFEFIYTEYSITIPGNVVVTYISGTSKYDLGSEITSANSLHYGDEIKITLTPQENMVASFEIFGAEETDSGTYKITENATITYSEEHTYLTFAETTGGYSVSGLKDNSVKSILINICKLFRHFRTMV